MVFSVFVGVAVIGGGPAGVSAALTLANAGVRVALLHRPFRAARRPGEALPPGVFESFRHIGSWHSCHHLRSFGIRSAWGDSGNLREKSFLFSTPGYGWHLDRT